MKILLGYIFVYAYLFGLLLLIGILQKKANLSSESSRKLVHIFVSFTWFIMICFFGYTWHIIIPPITFVILNYISYKKGIFSMMERNDKENDSLGTVYYPISVLILSILTIIDNRFVAPYGIGLFCMAFGDGLAPFFGQRYRSYKFKIFNSEKTLFGILTVFTCSLIISTVFALYYNLHISILELLLIAVMSALLELIGTKGIDNLLLPIGTAIITYLLIIL